MSTITTAPSALDVTNEANALTAAAIHDCKFLNLDDVNARVHYGASRGEWAALSREVKVLNAITLREAEVSITARTDSIMQGQSRHRNSETIPT